MEAQPFGNYELLEEVGKGPIATVFKARHRESGRIVALKLLSPFLTGQGYSYLTPFIEGAKAVARLKHPNIVLEFQVGASDGRYFVAREYIAGKSLLQVIRESGRLSQQEVIRIGSAVGSAIDAAHRVGVSHRHLKPSNVLLGEDGSIKVSDFCIARIDRRFSRTEAAGKLSEATYYLAPEGARVEEGAELGDIYSLGAILYHVATGRVPFSGETPDVVAYKKRTAEFTSPSAIAPGLSKALDKTIRISLSTSRRRRFQAAADFLGALEEASQDLTPAPRPAEPLGLNASLEIMRGKHQGNRIRIDRRRKYLLEIREKGQSKRYCTLINDGQKLYISALAGATVLVNGEKIKARGIRSGDVISMEHVQLRCWISPRGEDAEDVIELAVKKDLLTPADKLAVLEEIVREEASGRAVTAGEVMLAKKLATPEQVSSLRAEFDSLLRAETSPGTAAKPSLALLGGRVGQIQVRADGKVVMELGSLTIGEEALATAREAGAPKGGPREPGLLDDVIFCSRCEEVVPSEDIIKGIAMQTGGKTFCRRCSAVDTTIGSVIATNKFRSSYRIERLLGKGSLGKVYRATNLLNGDVVALKIVPDRLGENRQVVERLEACMLSAATLKHPSLVSVMPVELTQNDAFLPMELAGDKTAADLAPQAPLSPSDENDKVRLQSVVDLIFQLCAALDTVHRVHIVHGEIRPEKIFIGEGGIVRLADAGLPTRIIKGDFGGEALLAAHKKRYVAPEILAGQLGDPRADVYSLGMVLCLLLVGAAYFRSHTPQGGEPNALQEAILGADALPDSIPAKLIKLIHRMINAEPEARFPSVPQVMREIVRLQKELGG